MTSVAYVLQVPCRLIHVQWHICGNRKRDLRIHNCVLPCTRTPAYSHKCQGTQQPKRVVSCNVNLKQLIILRDSTPTLFVQHFLRRQTFHLGSRLLCFIQTYGRLLRTQWYDQGCDSRGHTTLISKCSLRLTADKFYNLFQSAVTEAGFRHLV